MSLLYLHHKGGLYISEGNALDCTNGAERTVIHYRDVIDGEPFVRLASEFEEQIEWPDGKVRPRFLGVETLEELVEAGVAAALAQRDEEIRRLNRRIQALDHDVRRYSRQLQDVKAAVTR